MRFHLPSPVTRRERVSVVIPCYRYGHFLETAVESVLSQEGVDVDVLVVDDASDDGSGRVAERLAARDHRVRTIVHSTNAGHIATYNEGLAQVDGDHVVLLSADDALASGALERAAALLQRFPRVGLVYGHAESFTEAVPVVDSSPRSLTTWSGSEWLASMCRRAKNPIYTPSVVMRREAWEQIGRYDARVPHAADMLLWYQTALRWDIGRVNSRAQAFYRVHGANMHLTQFAGMLRDLNEQREVVRIVFAESPNGMAPPDSLRRRALGSMARRAGRLAAAELREGGDDDAARALAQFAAETAALAGDRAPGQWQRRVDAWLEGRRAGLARRVEEHVAWRLWRRYGT